MTNGRSQRTDRSSVGSLVLGVDDLLALEADDQHLVLVKLDSVERSRLRQEPVELVGARSARDLDDIGDDVDGLAADDLLGVGDAHILVLLGFD